MPCYFSVIIHPSASPVNTIVNPAPLVETVPFAVAPNIFLPFGLIVKAADPKLLFISKIAISSPAAGAEGSVMVKAPLVAVSIKTFCPLNTFAVVVNGVVVQLAPFVLPPPASV